MLSPRLQAVADRIHGPRHADIGSDHAQLAFYLQTRLEKVIAVEKHPGPLENTRLALKNTVAEVRHGDGLEPLREGEIDSLSICGMGSLNIRDILHNNPEKLPPQLVLQPMDNAQPIRHWARRHGYHLHWEAWLDPYTILELQRRPGPDPAYQDLPVEAEFFGPLLLADPNYVQRQRDWLKSLNRTDARLDFLLRWTP